MREDLRQAAVEATVSWARRFTPRPWRFAELVTDVRSSDSIYARAVTRWVRKIPVWRTTPHQGSKRVSSPAITPDQVHPWAVDETHLAQQSWHVTTCPTCDGDKKVQCPSCGGRGRVGCVDCEASGRVISSSSKKFRTVNSRRCQGTGAMRCTTCRNGRVECFRVGGIAGLEKSRVSAVMGATKVVGVYLVPDSTASSSLAAAELDAFSQATLGTSAPPSLLRKAGKGVKHTTGSIAGHTLVLGFYDAQLIEVALGMVKP